jgi:GDP-L-fucose synthase
MKKSDTILVTGANGLVGSAVVEHLTALGYSNVLSVSRENCDLRDAEKTLTVFKIARPKYVFHAAARVHGILGNMNHQAQSYLENTQISCSVVDAAAKCGVEKIVVMGTGAVYPFPHTFMHDSRFPMREEMIFNGRPHPSESGYAHAKRGTLAMLEAYETTYGLDWAYIVSCNLFGPRDKFDMINGHIVPSLIAKFYNAFLSDDPVTVWGDGSAQRDFLYVKDVARAVHLVLQNGGGAINMGGGLIYSIRSIVEMLIDFTGCPSERIEWDASKPNGQAYRAYDLTQIKALGFRPIYSIEDGLRETWDWYTRNPR